jgi:glycosyltransferase involved in cell wall biosynthesis
MVAAAYFPSVGGVETHVHEVSRRMAAAGVEVTVLATDLSGELPQREQLDGVEIRRVRAYPADRDWRLAPGVDRVIGSQPWDLVHCQGYHTFVPPLALLAARRRGIPSLMTLHSGGPVSGIRLRVRGAQLAVMRPLLRSARAIVAVSQYEQDLFVDRLRFSPARFRVIPNGAELPPPQNQPRADAGAIGPHVVSVGRLVEYKGHQRAIEAMPAILASHPGATLQIVGSGPYEAELRSQIERLGLDQAVSITAIAGSDRQAMSNLVAAADVVVLLSQYESQGIAAFEALALGRPLVVSDTSALTQLGRDGHARLVPLDASGPQTAEAIVAAALAGPPPGPRPSWTWDDCSNALLDLYRSIGVKLAA